MQIDTRLSTDHVMSIDIEQLKPHPLNQKIYGLPSTSFGFSQLMESIRLYGVLEPLLVNSELTVLSGHRRLAAAIEVGLRSLPTRVFTGLDQQEQENLIILLNQHRERSPSVIVHEVTTLEQNNQGQRNGNIVSEGRDALDCFATSTKCGDKRMFEQARLVVSSGNEDLIALMDTRTITTAYRKLHRSQQHLAFYPSLVKPSDNWNFSPIQYPRIDKSQTVGYIPGDIYANCFWYFVKPGDYVVDPMAGSGMANHVYEHRHEWMGKHSYDFSLNLFDLTPQAEDIKQHDLLVGFPTDRADYIFLDLPYLGMAKHAYSKKTEDLANMHEDVYRTAVCRIADICASVQTSGQLCTVISPNYTNHRKREVTNMTEYIRDCWRSAGYMLYLETYASRRIQQSQSLTIAKLNNIAKERRLPLTDMMLIMTFQRSETSSFLSQQSLKKAHASENTREGGLACHLSQK